MRNRFGIGETIWRWATGAYFSVVEYHSRQKRHIVRDHGLPLPRSRRHKISLPNCLVAVRDVRSFDATRHCGAHVTNDRTILLIGQVMISTAVGDMYLPNVPEEITPA